MRLHIITFILLSIITIQRCQVLAGVEADLVSTVVSEIITVAPTKVLPTLTTGGPTTGGVTSSTPALSWDWNNNYNLDDDDPGYNYNDDNYMDGKRYRDNDDSYGNYNNDKYKSKSSYKKPDSMGHLNVYISESSNYGKKGKPKKIRFPTARYERKRFPRFGPLLSFLPWVPIFADRLTKQTIIFSPTGGIYIIPPVINFYGRLFSVAELIADGYASLVSSGAPPPPAVDVAPLVQPGAVVGPGIPPLDRRTGGFRGGVQTQLRSLSKPKYPTRVNDQYNAQPYPSPAKSRGAY